MTIFLSMLLALLGAPRLYAAAPPIPPELKQGLEAAYAAQLPEAYAAVNRFVLAHPDDPQGYIVRGTVGEWEQKLRNKKELAGTIIDDFEKAKQLAFRAFDRDPHNVDALVNLGNSYLRLGKKWGDEGKWWRAALISKKCRRHLEKAVLIDKERWDAYLSLGAFRYVAANLPAPAKPFASLLGIQGDRAQGIREVKRAVENPNLYQLDATYLLKYIYRKEARYGEVVTLLEQFSKNFPNNPEIRYDLAIAYRDAKQPERALGQVEALRDCSRKEMHTACHERYEYLSDALAGDLCRSVGKADAAIAAYERVLRLPVYSKPERYAEIEYHLGMLYERKKNDARATELYHEILTLSGKNLKPWHDKANARLTLLEKNRVSK